MASQSALDDISTLFDYTSLINIDFHSCEVDDEDNSVDMYKCTFIAKDLPSKDAYISAVDNQHCITLTYGSDEGSEETKLAQLKGNTYTMSPLDVCLFDGSIRGRIEGDKLLEIGGRANILQWVEGKVPRTGSIGNPGFTEKLAMVHMHEACDGEAYQLRMQYNPKILLFKIAKMMMMFLAFKVYRTSYINGSPSGAIPQSIDLAEFRVLRKTHQFSITADSFCPVGLHRYFLLSDCQDDKVLGIFDLANSALRLLSITGEEMLSATPLTNLKKSTKVRSRSRQEIGLVKISGIQFFDQSIEELFIDTLGDEVTESYQVRRKVDGPIAEIIPSQPRSPDEYLVIRTEPEVDSLHKALILVASFRFCWLAHQFGSKLIKKRTLEHIIDSLLAASALEITDL